MTSLTPNVLSPSRWRIPRVSLLRKEKTCERASAWILFLASNGNFVHDRILEIVKSWNRKIKIKRRHVSPTRLIINNQHVYTKEVLLSVWKQNLT